MKAPKRPRIRSPEIAAHEPHALKLRERAGAMRQRQREVGWDTVTLYLTPKFLLALAQDCPLLLSRIPHHQRPSPQGGSRGDGSEMAPQALV